MENKLIEIIKEAKDKYGVNHPIAIETAQAIVPFIKSSADREGASESLEAEHMINIDELKSLINPQPYEFERQTIGTVGVEK